MAIKKTGPLTFTDIVAEFGDTTNPAHSLSEFYAGGANVPAGAVGYPNDVETPIPTTGRISFSNFYGAAKRYLLAMSTRLRASTKAYFERTFSSSPTTFTLSMWVKRGKLGERQTLAAARAERARTASHLDFNDQDQLNVELSDTSTNSGSITTTAKFRDPSAWYHIVLSAKAGDKVILSVNGKEVGSAGVSTGFFLFTNSNNFKNTLGKYGDYDGSYFDGYMSDIYFVDGQALPPTSFAEADKEYGGMWVPKKYSGTYGTNGFYLKGAPTNYEGASGRASSDRLGDWSADEPSHGTVFHPTFTAPASGSFILQASVHGGGGEHRLEYRVAGGQWTELYSGTGNGDFQFKSSPISGTGIVEVRSSLRRTGGGADANFMFDVLYFPDANNSSTDAKDESGNGNNFTTHGGVDPCNDVPMLTSETKANYAVVNPLQGIRRPRKIENGNLTISSEGDDQQNIGTSTLSMHKEKVYWETTVELAASNGWEIGVIDIHKANGSASDMDSRYAYKSIDGKKRVDTAESDLGVSYTNGDVIGITYDGSNGELKAYKNNVLQGLITTLDTSKHYLAMWKYDQTRSNNKVHVNFGQLPFKYTPPAGFKSLNTFNIKEGS